jgi:hypothetical protein
MGSLKKGRVITIPIYGICSHGMTDDTTFVAMYKPHFEASRVIALLEQLEQ